MHTKTRNWSTGDVSDEVLNTFEDLNNSKKVSEKSINKVLQEVGDACGCPAPHKVAETRGNVGALKYLVSLSIFYKEIAEILDEHDVSWKKDWGKKELRDVTEEPWGENASNVPEDIRRRNVLGGPGNYREFSVTRLLWENKTEKNPRYKIGDEELKKIIQSANSLDELQVNLISVMADVRLPGRSVEDVVEIIVSGIAHEGFFRQNNPYKKVRKVLNLLETKYGRRVWFKLLEKKCLELLNSPATKFS